MAKAADRVELFLRNWQADRTGSTSWIARARPSTAANDTRWAPLTALDLRALIRAGRAAPELLKSLERLTLNLRRRRFTPRCDADESGSCGDCALCRAEAAIAKAVGNG